MPKVSVCLPVYNGERFLAEAIESVLQQTFTDFELLISDDCSTDNSAKIAAAYAAKDPRIVLWTNDHNKGLFANYNVCIERASGDHIKLFAQDDLIESQMLERQLAVLEQNSNVKLVSTGKRWIADDGGEIKSVRPFAGNKLISGREVIRYNLIQLNNWVGEPSTVMFRRAHAGEGFDSRFYHYGDIEYWFRIVENGDYYYLDEVLCGFRRHQDSSTSSNLAGLFFALDIFLLGKKYRRYCEELGETEEHFAKRALEVIAQHLDHLVRNEDVSVEQTLSIHKGSEHGEQLDAFKELTFHSLRYITELIASYDALRCRTNDEREYLLKQIENMKQSTSWKVTAPLRQMMHRGHQ